MTGRQALLQKLRNLIMERILNIQDEEVRAAAFLAYEVAEQNKAILRDLRFDRRK